MVGKDAHFRVLLLGRGYVDVPNELARSVEEAGLTSPLLMALKNSSLTGGFDELVIDGAMKVAKPLSPASTHALNCSIDGPRE